MNDSKYYGLDLLRGIAGYGVAITHYLYFVKQKVDFSNKELNIENLIKSNDQLVIGFQIGSSLEGRRWSTQSFANLADLLIQKLNVHILLFGVESESKSAKEMMDLTCNKSRVTDFTGKTDLKQLSAIVIKMVIKHIIKRSY